MSPVVQLESPPQKLAQYQVWLTDINPNSDYFAVSQIPQILTAGKNFFLINGTLNLVPTTEVLIEIIDSLGNPVYQHPISGYQEGLARAISIEIYNDTPSGLATLTILGHISQDINGNKPPAQFENAYNVRWQKQIQINSAAQNISPIRTYAYPTASVEERLVMYSDSSHSIVSINQGTLTGIATTGPGNTELNNYYAVQLSNSPSQSFSNEMIGGTVLANISGLPFTSSIIKVLNRNIAFIGVGYTGSNLIYTQFTTDTFSINYTSSASLIPTQYTRSYADISISNLDTFAGNIFRIKAYVAPQNDATAWELVDDTLTKPLSIMATQSIENIIYEAGYVKTQNDVNNRFSYGFVNDSASFFA